VPCAADYVLVAVPMRARLIACLSFAALAACSQHEPEPTNAAAPAAAQNAAPADFVPLQSAPVKDAIHRALRTGQTQRWQDGKLSGYAVPSAAFGPQGCRAVRYTVDQRPVPAYESVTACDADR
jgi:hypothetical protein